MFDTAFNRGFIKLNLKDTSKTAVFDIALHGIEVYYGKRKEEQ
jgi:hypothetical protein